MELQRGAVHADHPAHPLDAVAAFSRGRRLLPAIVLLLSAAPAHAQVQVSVEVSPLRVELQAGPGGTTTQAITLTNGGRDPVRIRARLTDWDLSKDGTPQFEGVPEGGRYSATTWVRIAPPEQVLDPGKEGIVRFSLTVPAGVEPAGYRTAVLFEFLPAEGDPVARARQVQFRSRVATLIYVNIGQPPPEVDLTNLLIRPAADATRIVAILRNTSRRTVRTKGTLTLYDTGGKQVVQVPVPDVPLLPESEREVAITAFEASAPLPPGDYRVEVRIDAGMPALLVGETTLKVAR